MKAQLDDGEELMEASDQTWTYDENRNFTVRVRRRVGAVVRPRAGRRARRRPAAVLKRARALLVLCLLDRDLRFSPAGLQFIYSS